MRPQEDTTMSVWHEGTTLTAEEIREAEEQHEIDVQAWAELYGESREWAAEMLRARS
jgi:hypothetical protein